MTQLSRHGARLLVGLCAAIALLTVGAAGPARAQSACSAVLASCQAACAERCSAAGGSNCDAVCAADRECDAAYFDCELLNSDTGSSTLGGAASAPPAPAPATRSRAPAAEAAVAAAPAPFAPAEAGLEGRIFFLLRAEAEPPADYYGYILIGANVPADRKNAVAEGLACRLDVVSAEAAAQMDALGLISIPATGLVAADVVAPDRLLQLYDFPRAERWLRAASFAADTPFDPDEAILFIGSASPRARQLDSVALPGDGLGGAGGDPVIADASALSPRYLSRWTAEVIDGVRGGAVQSRQDMQTLMEAHSWLELIGDPLAAVMRIGPAEAAPTPAACF